MVSPTIKFNETEFLTASVQQKIGIRSVAIHCIELPLLIFGFIFCSVFLKVITKTRCFHQVRTFQITFIKIGISESSISTREFRIILCDCYYIEIHDRHSSSDILYDKQGCRWHPLVSDSQSPSWLWTLCGSYQHHCNRNRKNCSHSKSWKLRNQKNPYTRNFHGELPGWLFNL